MLLIFNKRSHRKYTETNKFSQSTSHKRCCFDNRKRWNVVKYINLIFDSNTIQDRTSLFYACFHTFDVSSRWLLIKKNSASRRHWGAFRDEVSSPFQKQFWFQIHTTNGKPTFWSFVAFNGVNLNIDCPLNSQFLIFWADTLSFSVYLIV